MSTAVGYCGLDFGTSNSTIGIVAADGARLCRLEGDSATLPSAIFYDFEAHRARFGRDGIQHYIEGTEGRLLRSLKSVLGSSLIDDVTLIQRRRATKWGQSPLISTEPRENGVQKMWWKCGQSRIVIPFSRQLSSSTLPSVVPSDSGINLL
jgi:molecular chaperone DnaK (HSP70)